MCFSGSGKTSRVRGSDRQSGRFVAIQPAKQFEIAFDCRVAAMKAPNDRSAIGPQLAPALRAYTFVVSDAAHMIPMTRPEAVADAVRSSAVAVAT